MKRALVISVALHGVAGALWIGVALRAGDAPHDAPPAISIEVIAPRDPIAPPATAVRDVAGGGSTLAVANEAKPRPAPANQAGRARAPAPAVEPAELGDYVIEPAERHRVQPEAGGVERDGDGGEGNGLGGQRGAGIGFGDGGTITLAAQVFAVPKPPADLPPPSQARPAKLIYPSRQRDLGQDRLFVARVTVDDEGFVVGARLVHGVSGPRDDEAADLIFRFRYLPALDDAGRAIRSTFEQPFHVNR